MWKSAKLIRIWTWRRHTRFLSRKLCRRWLCWTTMENFFTAAVTESLKPHGLCGKRIWSHFSSDGRRRNWSRATVWVCVVLSGPKDRQLVAPFVRTGHARCWFPERRRCGTRVSRIQLVPALRASVSERVRFPAIIKGGDLHLSSHRGQKGRNK